MANSYKAIHAANQSLAKNILNQARSDAIRPLPYSISHVEPVRRDIVPAAKSYTYVREIIFDTEDPIAAIQVQSLITCAGKHMEKCSHRHALEIFLNYFKVYYVGIFGAMAPYLLESDIKVITITLAEYEKECEESFGTDAMEKYLAFEHTHASWVGGIIANFIGKNLGEKNYRQWYENRVMGYCIKCGVTRDDPLIPELKFSLAVCARIYESISSKSNVRRDLFFLFRGFAQQASSGIGKAMENTMILLKGAEMTSFMFVSHYIANLHPILFGWNELGKYLPYYIAAATKYYQQPGDLAPYLKLYLDQKETEEFKADRLAVLATVAIAIAKVQGQKTTDNIRGYMEIADLPIVEQALQIVKAYGGANTVLTQSVREWDIDSLPNKLLLERMSEGSQDLEFEKPTGLPGLHNEAA